MIRFFEQVGQVTKLILETLYYVICGEIDFKEVVKQMLALGVKSIPIVLTVSGFTGMVFSLQVSQEFELFWCCFINRTTSKFSCGTGVGSSIDGSGCSRQSRICNCC